MTLGITLRPLFSLPRPLRAHADEPEQEYHWLGKTQETPKDRQGSKNQNRKPEQKNDNQGYRPLASIKLGEVEQAISLFEHQLIPAQDNWIGKNHFCTIPLKRMRDGRPPLIFGFVTTCYPSDGHIENVEDVELLFPRRNGPSDPVYLHKDELNLYSQRMVQSHYLRVQFKISDEDKADFEASVSSFAANGFHPEFDREYYDLLEMNNQNRSAYPLLYVIGSRWLASIPDSRYFEFTNKLKEMLGWGKYIFNYHPDWLPKEVHTLNRELDFQYGFTPTVLVEPKDPNQTIHILVETRHRLFKGPQNHSS